MRTNGPPSRNGTPACGNALFLILIAVALFAALSYAVTQSSRGGTSPDRELLAINAARVVDYKALLHSTVQRMLLTGTDTADLTFCSSGPGTWCEINAANVCTSGPDCVFAPEGGGMPPAERLKHPQCEAIGSFGAPGECPWIIDGADAFGWDPAAFGTSETDIILLLHDVPLDLWREIRGQMFSPDNYPDLDIDDVHFKRIATPFSTDGLGIVLVVR